MANEYFKNPHSATNNPRTSYTEYDLVVVGELNMDLILDHVNSLPGLEKEVICKSMNLTIGSSSAIMALNAAALGLKVNFVGKIGNDDFGKTCLNALNSRSIDTTNVLISELENTGLTCIYTQERKRGMITYPGSMESFTLDEIPDQVFKSAKHLHLSSYYLQKGLKPDVPNLFKIARENGMTTSFDTNFDPDEKWGNEVLDVLDYVDIFFPNDQEAMKIAGTNTIEDAMAILTKHCKIVIVTCGSKGVMGQYGDVVFHAKGLRIDIKDAVGAGDTFNSGFLLEYLKGAELESCVISGIHSSAFSTTFTGGIEAFNHIDQYSEFCENHPVKFALEVLDNTSDHNTI